MDHPDALPARALVIRADADSRMGAGHVMRCLALAQAWSGSGGDVLFCGRVESASLRERLAATGFGLAEPGPRPGDAAGLLAARGLAGCWVALDGYHFGPQWQEELEAAGHKVLAVDDGALLSRYAARVILAPDHEASPAAYAAPPATLVLAGPRYRLLRQGFAGLPRPNRRPGEGAVLLLAFGGADAGNATRSAVRSLDAALGPQDTALVVLGPVNPHRESVQAALAEAQYRFELHQDVSDIAGLYARAHLAVSAGGGAAWEMAAAGLPALLVPVAANQEPGAAFLARAGAAEVLSGPRALETRDFAARVRRLLDDPARLAALSAAGPRACDGRGPQRVCRVLTVLGGGGRDADFVLRRAEPGDLEQVFRLANDPAVRGNSFSTGAIALAGHAAWYAAKLADPGCVFFVLDLEGAVAALARFDREDDAAAVDVAVHPAFRGRGLGVRMLRESAPRALAGLGVARLRAEVLESNIASRRCFARAGFREMGLETVQGHTCAVFLRDAGAGEG